jgi:hypothetical protein
MGQKYKVHRSAIIDLVRRSCGTDLMGQVSESELVEAVRVLDRIKTNGLAVATSSHVEPDVTPDRHTTS